MSYKRRKKLRQVAREPAREIIADRYLIRVYPEAQIIAFYKRYIEGNRIVTSKRPLFRIKAHDFKSCPESLDQFRAWLNKWDFFEEVE